MNMNLYDNLSILRHYMLTLGPITHMSLCRLIFLCSLNTIMPSFKIKSIFRVLSYDNYIKLSLLYCTILLFLCLLFLFYICLLCYLYSPGASQCNFHMSTWQNSLSSPACWALASAALHPQAPGPLHGYWPRSPPCCFPKFFALFISVMISSISLSVLFLQISSAPSLSLSSEFFVSYSSWFLHFMMEDFHKYLLIIGCEFII